MGIFFDVWQRIECWYSLNAPELGLSLAPPASMLAIHAIESELGSVLPQHIVDSYCVHDGSDGFPIFQNGHELLSADKIIKEWRRMKELSGQYSFENLATSPKGPILPVAWSLGWIPFASNMSGDFTCVDMLPAQGGSIGQIISYGHEEGPSNVLSDNFYDWLILFAGNLENGQYHFDQSNGCLVSNDEM